MRLARLYFALILVADGRACAQNASDEWFPAHVGDKWTYEYTSRDENGRGRAHLDVHAWKTEEMTTGLWVVPEGTLIERQVRIVEGSPREGWGTNATPAYLLQGNCVYGDLGDADWDASAHQLNPHFLVSLTAGEVSPNFCFPLTLHKMWGAPHGLPDWNVPRPEQARDWAVVSVTVRDPATPAGQTTFHIINISAYPGSGETVDTWFAKGVGVVRKDEVHHGTIGELRTRLLRFQPASRQ